MTHRNRDKFVLLAEKRVSRTIKDIKLVGNLSNRTNYSYTDEDAAKIYKALKKAVEDCRARFDRKGSSEDDIFRL